MSPEFGALKRKSDQRTVTRVTLQCRIDGSFVDSLLTQSRQRARIGKLTNARRRRLCKVFPNY